MSEAEVIAVMRQHFEGKFPKECRVCGRVYADLKDYLLHTTHVGPPVCYDLEAGEYQPTRPIGTTSLANCACGNTLSLDSEGFTLVTKWRLMCWLLSEMARRRLSASAVLEDLRRTIDEVTLAEPGARH